MIKNRKFKKGIVLHVKYHFLKNGIRNSSGIVIKESNKVLYLGHNFRGVKPIDTTRIVFEDIIKVEEISPKEINTPKDLVF